MRADELFLTYLKTRLVTYSFATRSAVRGRLHEYRCSIHAMRAFSDEQCPACMNLAIHKILK